jgi:hypothetical protein
MVDHNDIARTRRRISRRLSHARIDVNGAVEDAAAESAAAVRDASGQVTENVAQAATTAKEVVQSHLPSPQRSLAIGAAFAAVVLAAIASVLTRRKQTRSHDHT